MQNTEFSSKQIFNFTGAASAIMLGGCLLGSSTGAIDQATATAGIITSVAGLATSTLLGDGLNAINRLALNPANSNSFATVFPFLGNRGQSINMRQAQTQPGNTQFAAQVKRLETKVVNSLTENKIPFTNRVVVIAPRHITIKFRLGMNDNTTLKRAFACDRSIGLNTGLARVRLYIDGVHFCVELPNPQPQTVYASQLKGSRGVNVPVGISSARETVYIDFANPTTPHLALPGPTGSGKTQTERTIAYHLARQNMPEDVKFIVFAQKREDWEVFRNLPHLAAIITDPGEIVLAMKWLQEFTRLRSENASMSRKPRLFLFIDDTIALLNVTQGEIQESLEYISAQGRAPGVHLVFGTQDWTNAGSGGSVVKANVQARILFGATSTTKAASSAGRGQTGAHKLEGKGDTLYICNNEEIATAAAMVTDKEIVGLLQGGRAMPGEWRPWLDEQPVQRKSQPKPTSKAGFVSVEPKTQSVDTNARILKMFVNERLGVKAIVSQIWGVDGGRKYMEYSELVNDVIREALSNSI